MMPNKYIFGITGGSGVGKTTVSDLLKQYGCDIIDCDKIARDVTAKGSPCLKEIADEFGKDILDKDGQLLRKKLGNIVFSDKVKLDKLNVITHKYITADIDSKIKKSKKSLIGIDGAVIIESGVTKKCDCTIGVLADKKIRINRIAKRDGLSYAEAENRVNSQKFDEFYIENCDYIIYNNNKDTDDLLRQVKEVAEKLEHEKRRKKTNSDVPLQ